MAKFAIKTIESIKGKYQFKQLIILKDTEDDIKIQQEINKHESNDKEVNYKGQLDIYENNLEDKYQSSFKSILTLMDLVANLQSLPKVKFRDITPNKEIVKEYEFKHGDLRVYAIKMSHGKIIILGGYKNSQPSDIIKFRSLKNLYLKSLN